MSQTKPSPIAIIGGGPCGLTLARLLELDGLDYVVFERDASPAPASHHQGGTLDIHPGTGQAALEAAGLKDAFKNLARYEADIFTVQDAQGENRYRTGDDGAVGEGDRPEIDRRQLRELLLNSIPAHRIRWGKTLKKIEHQQVKLGGAASQILRFADGSSESGFRLIVGADGAWSKVRPLITPAKPTYSGKSYIEGRISPGNPQYAAAQELAGPGTSATCGAGRVLVVQQLSDRTYRLYAGIEEEESLARPGGILDFATDIEKSRAALIERFADFAPHIRAFVEHAEGPWRVWPLYYLEAATFAPEADGRAWFRVPGVTLLGDAAHVALPNGEGVNLAMFDALRLFQCLSAELAKEGETFDAKADVATIERAIVAYETEMRKNAAEHVVDGIEMNEMMYKADGAQRMAAFFKQFGEGANEQ
ncbi:monooxygenase [Xylaria cf. heliscus]|nr:monooxygenase [Xylaria cf. heliscus]